MKYIIAVLILIILGLTGASAFLGWQYLNNQKLIAENQSTISDLQNKAVVLQNQIDQRDADIKDITGKLTAAETKNSELVSKNQDLLNNYSAASSKAYKFEGKYNSLLCENQLTDMSYTDIMNASVKLQSYVLNQPDVKQVSLSSRNTIWSNFKSKVHMIRFVHSDGKVYAHAYMVYFSEFGLKKAVFDLRNQCWAAAP